MNTPLRLDQPNCLPKSFLNQLRSFDSEFSRTNHIEKILDNSEFAELTQEIEAFIRDRSILGYHCTKEIRPRYYRRNGLRILNLRQHVDEFLDFVQKKVTKDLFRKFEENYSHWLRSDSIPGREGRIAFCLSSYLVKDKGTARFFTYFGGEALYWPFMPASEPDCLEVLAGIGSPVVLEVIIPVSDLMVFQSYAFTRDIVSHYAKTINPKFQISSLEGFISRDVAPEEITNVYAKDDFWEQFWPEILQANNSLHLD